IQSRYIRQVISARIDPPKNLQVPGQRRFVERIRSLQRRPAVDYAGFEYHAGDILNFARKLCTDAKTRGFRELSDDALQFFDVEIAGEIRTQTMQAVGFEKFQTPFSEFSQVTRIEIGR